MGLRVQARNASRAADLADSGEARPAFQRAVHPSEVLRDEIAAVGLTLATFARQIGMPTGNVTRIVNGQRVLTARTALRLAHWFRTGPEFWLNLQVQYDLGQVEEGERRALLSNSA
jgi:antitoxin HigA-1